MTALNIRKNLAFILHTTADAVENLSAPKVQLTDKLTDKVRNTRQKLADYIAPKA